MAFLRFVLSGGIIIIGVSDGRRRICDGNVSKSEIGVSMEMEIRISIGIRIGSLMWDENDQTKASSPQ